MNYASGGWKHTPMAQRLCTCRLKVSRVFCLCALNKTKCVVLMPLPYVTFAPLAPCPIKDGSLRVSTGLGCVVREGILCSVLRGLCLYEGMPLCVASLPLPL